VKLARYLETGSFVPALGSKPVSADVRIICATEARPANDVREGRFREDLLQQLEVFPIHLPPLRRRGADIAMLAQRFLDDFNKSEGTNKRFSRAALARLAQHTWPGNVRELKVYVHRAYLHAGYVIDGGDSVRTVAAADDTDDLITLRIGMPLDEIERRVTMATLARCNGVKKRAAAILGISLKTLYNRLAAYSTSAHGAEIPEGTNAQTR